MVGAKSLYYFNRWFISVDVLWNFCAAHFVLDFTLLIDFNHLNIVSVISIYFYYHCSRTNTKIVCFLNKELQCADFFGFYEKWKSVFMLKPKKLCAVVKYILFTLLFNCQIINLCQNVCSIWWIMLFFGTFIL